MTADEPDIAALFAPVDIGTAVLGVVAEAEAALASVTDPVDAELWGSDVIGALAKAAGQPRAMTALAGILVPAAEAAATVTAHGVLRVLAVLGDAALRAAATDAALRLVKQDVPEPSWATGLGTPLPGTCWHYADTGGSQESVTMTFAYGTRQHGISVLVDHASGGTLKDAWLTKDDNQLLAAELTAGADPRIVFELLDPPQAAARIRQAVSAGERPEQPDQADDLTAHRSLLHARLALFPPS